MKTFILIMSLLTAFNRAQAAPLKPKFEGSLDKIQAELQRYVNMEIDVTALSQGNLRQVLFSIQTMAALYSSKYPSLENVRVMTKSLEDGIGNFRKTIEQLQYAVDNPQPQDPDYPTELRHLQERVDSGRSVLIAQLQNQGWTDIGHGKMLELHNEINSIGWDTDLKEQNDTYTLLANQLTTIDQTPWDMTVLEGGVGVHDLRKQIRWYKLEFEALADLVGTDATSCPAEIKKPSVDNGGRCLISECLNNKMTEIYVTFGDIKDHGEGEDGLGHGVPPELLVPAQELYTQIKTDHLFQNLAHEFKQCVQE
jgi:hypothetical protein